MYCSHYGKSEAMEMLLRRQDLDVEWRNNRGANVMQFVAKRGQLDMAKMLHGHFRASMGEEWQMRWFQFVNNQNDSGKR